MQDDAAAISGLSGTLYLGKLPSKPADGYFGVLSARPPATPKASALGQAGVAGVLPARPPTTPKAMLGLAGRYEESCGRRESLACAAGALPPGPSTHLPGHPSPARWPPPLQGTAVVGLQLGTQQPLFSLVAGGESVYAASGSSALLQVGPTLVDMPLIVLAVVGGEGVCAACGSSALLQVRGALHGCGGRLLLPTPAAAHRPPALLPCCLLS